MCEKVLGNRRDGNNHLMYDSRGRGLTVAVCRIHKDPTNSDWNMRWPCPHAPLTWARSRNYGTIHQSHCSFARLSWPWATGKTLLELLAFAKDHGFHFCKACVPTVDSAETLWKNND